MLYASSKDAIRKRLVGVAIEIQGTDLSEVSYEAVLEKASRSNWSSLQFIIINIFYVILLFK